MKFKWLYFGSAWCYSHMFGHTGSPTCTVYVGMTLTRSKVKVKVTGLLNFRKLAEPCMHAGGDDRQPPCGAFWPGLMYLLHLSALHHVGRFKITETSLSYYRWTWHCVMRMVLQTKVDVQHNKLTTVVDWTKLITLATINVPWQNSMFELCRTASTSHNQSGLILTSVSKW